MLGKSRISQVHVKNEDRLLEEPGRVNWAGALQAIRRMNYQGRLLFESAHSGVERCIEATTKNIEFIRRQLALA